MSHNEECILPDDLELLEELRDDTARSYEAAINGGAGMREVYEIETFQDQVEEKIKELKSQ